MNEGYENNYGNSGENEMNNGFGSQEANKEPEINSNGYTESFAEGNTVNNAQEQEKVPEPAEDDDFRVDVSELFSESSGFKQPSDNEESRKETSGSNPSESNRYMNYSPYNEHNYRGDYPPVEAPVKKKNKGIKIIAAVLAVAMCVSVFFIGTTVGKRSSGAPGNNTSDSAPSTNDANAPTGFVTQPSGKSDTDYKEGEVLTPAQINKKVSVSAVVILVYQNDNLAGSGSGVLWTESTDGKYTYVITCAHVVNAAGVRVIVQLDDSTQHDVVANGISYDEKTDLAVLKIEASGLPLAEFGDSSALNVGDPVYAIGSPGGAEYSNSFTGGYVSAIDRSVTSTYTMEYIQHDAAINPGNSGGVLVNKYGQVIGINSLKIVDEQYEGMGFAIPIKSAKDIVQNLVTYGYIPDRPKLGITYTAVSESWTYNFIVNVKGLPKGSLIIYEISENSAFKGTEAKAYDLITAVNGEKLDTADVLLDKIENSSVGDKLTLTLCRVIDNNYNIKTFDVEVTLVEDRGSENNSEQETTTNYYFNPYDYGNWY